MGFLMIFFSWRGLFSNFGFQGNYIKFIHSKLYGSYKWNSNNFAFGILQWPFLIMTNFPQDWHRKVRYVLERDEVLDFFRESVVPNCGRKNPMRVPNGKCGRTGRN
jgi:hypothetical protein